MAGTNLYLIRNNNLTWAKYSNVVDVFLSTKETFYASVTGVALTDVVTITGASLNDGNLITLTSLVDGAGLATGLTYYAIDASGATCKLSLTPGGSAVDFTTDITSATTIVSSDSMRAWSSEYRDIFTASTPIQTDLAEVDASGNWYGGQEVTSPVAALPTGLKNYDSVVNTPGVQAEATEWRLTADAFTANVSDEINHFPLRQTLLQKTFWLFDMGASAQPRYLPAEYQEGDIIATSPPQVP
jgi:hypothetical protein